MGVIVPGGVPRPLQPGEKAFVDALRAVCPQEFLMECPTGYASDIRLLGIGQLALADYNTAPPREGRVLANMDPNLLQLIVMGSLYYIAMLTQMEFSLVDIQYNDNGLSLNLDRVGQIGNVLQNLEKQWLRVLQNRKNNVLLSNGGVGLGSPRFQSNLSKMISFLGNGAFGWNIS